MQPEPPKHRAITFIFGLIVSLAVLGALFPSVVKVLLNTIAPAGREAGAPDSREDTTRSDIEWAQDGPPGLSNLEEAATHRPLIAATGRAETEADPFRQAIRQGDVAAVRRMLAGDTGLVRGAKPTLPPLFDAIMADDTEILRLLIDAGADIDTTYRIDGKEIHNAVSYAARYERRQALSLLLAAGADAGRLVCAPGGLCGNALSVAALTGDAALLREMIERGKLGDRVINLRGITSYHTSALSIVGHRTRIMPALHMAARGGHTEAARALVELGADLDRLDAGNRRAEYHARFAKAKAIQQLFDAERTRTGELVGAILLGGSQRMQRMQRMLADGANPNLALRRGPTPLVAAIGEGDREAVKMLLAAGADPNRVIRESTPIYAAMARRDLEIVRLLLGAGADPNEYRDGRMPPFADAVLADERALVQAYLDAGASLTTRYQTRDRVIHNILSYALARNRPTSAVVLAHAGVDPDWLTCTPEEICGNTLTLAALSGNAQLVRDLIVEGRFSPETINLAGATERDLRRLGSNLTRKERRDRLLLPPLHAAARAGHAETVEVLLALGADPGHKDIAGRVAADYAGSTKTAEVFEAWAARAANLAAAIEAGDAVRVRELVDAGVDPNAPASEHRMPPLLLAARTNSGEVVRALLDAGAEIDLVYRDEFDLIQTALSYAALNGQGVSARLLLRAGADPGRLVCSNKRCGNTLTMAALSGNAQLVGDLIADGNLGAEHIDLLNLSQEDILRAFPGRWSARYQFALLPPLHAAYMSGNRETVELLFELGADRDRLDDRGRRASELARALPQMSIDEKATALVAAVEQGNLEEVAAVLAAGADPNIAMTDGRAPLLMAVKAGDIEIVRTLLAGGADPERPLHASSEHPLHMAIQKGHGEVVQLLLEHGADLNATYRDEAEEPHTALGDAIAYGHTEIALMLIDRGADTDAGYSRFESWEGSYLSLAALKGDEALVRRLIEAGNEVSPQLTMTSREVYASVTPLIAAVWGNHPDIVALLLEEGADVSTKNNYGCSAYDFALINERTEAVELLRDAGSVADEAGCDMYRYRK